MTEVIQYLPAEASAEPLPLRFTYSRPEQSWLNRTLIRAIERTSGQPHLETLYRNWAAHATADENFFTAAIRLLGIEADIRAGSWSSVPESGPVLFVANHPFGVVDGLLMGHLCSQVRPDVKIITHSLLCQTPEARSYLLPVDFAGTLKAAQTSALTRRRSVEWLRDGHAVVIFPAGSVSTAQYPLRGAALDAPWHPFTAKLATQPGVTVVPVCFHGQNSRLFQLASHISYALRIALLFRETRRRSGTRIGVSVGEPVAAASLAVLASREDIVADLRRRTLSLKGPRAPHHAEAFIWPSHIRFD